MAEHLGRALLTEKKIPNVELDSAGVAPATWLPSPAEMQDALKEKGINNVMHSPRGLTQDRIASADVILVMEESHKAAVLSRFPEAKEKVFLLNEYAGGGNASKGISDPFGQSVAVYRQTLSEIEDALIRVIQKIQK